MLAIDTVVGGGTSDPETILVSAVISMFSYR
jgi:hypothetical protein